MKEHVGRGLNGNIATYIAVVHTILDSSYPHAQFMFIQPTRFLVQIWKTTISRVHHGHYVRGVDILVLHLIVELLQLIQVIEHSIYHIWYSTSLSHALQRKLLGFYQKHIHYLLEEFILILKVVIQCTAPHIQSGLQVRNRHIGIPLNHIQLNSFEKYLFSAIFYHKFILFSTY